MKDEMVCLEPFDWRYSAAIVGLRKYLEWLGVEESDLTITEESLEYNKKYFNRRDFLKFAEFYFKNEMHHIAIEEILLFFITFISSSKPEVIYSIFDFSLHLFFVGKLIINLLPVL